MKIGIAQVEDCASSSESLDTVRRVAAEAGARGVELLLFPEMLMAAPQDRREIAGLVEPLDGPYVAELGRAAAENSLSLAAGLWESVPGEGRVRNTYALLNPEGRLGAVYRKLHLFDALKVKESAIMLPGEEAPPCVLVGGFRVGMAICYDLRFPELFRWLMGQGAELVVVPAAWYAGPFKEEHWRVLLQARAIENTVYVAGVGLTGQRFCGRSCLVDPFGEVCQAAGEEEALLVAQLSREHLEQVRGKLPVLEHPRLDVLGPGSISSGARGPG